MLADAATTLVKAEEAAAAAEAAKALDQTVHTHGATDADVAAAEEAAFRSEFPDFLSLHFAGVAGERRPPAIGDASAPGVAAAVAAQPVNGGQGRGEAAVDPWLLASMFLKAVAAGGSGKGPQAVGAGAAGPAAAFGTVAAAADALQHAVRGYSPGAWGPQATQRDVAAQHVAVSSSSFAALAALLADPLAPAAPPPKARGAAARSALPSFNAREYHFFRDANVGEASVAVGPLRALSRRVVGLLRLFPGNAVLLHLLRLIDATLALPAAAPLPSFAAGVSLLLTRCADWEQNAAGYVALGEPLRALSALLTRWRALELRCWDALLACADGDAERDAAELWLRLHRFLYASTTCEEEEEGGAGELAVASGVQVSDALVRGALCGATPVLRGIALRHAWWAAPVPRWLQGGAAGGGGGAAELFAVPLGRLVSAAGDAAPAPSGEPGAATEAREQELVQQAFEAADRFVRSASLGQFAPRLALLQASARDLVLRRPRGAAPGGAADARGLRLGCMLHCVCAFYGQYVAMLTRAREAAVAPVVKVRLAAGARRCCCSGRARVVNAFSLPFASPPPIAGGARPDPASPLGRADALRRAARRGALAPHRAPRPAALPRGAQRPRRSAPRHCLHCRPVPRHLCLRRLAAAAACRPAFAAARRGALHRS